MQTYTRQEIVAAAKRLLEQGNDLRVELLPNLEMIVDGWDEVGKVGATQITRKGDIFQDLLSYIERV